MTSGLRPVRLYAKPAGANHAIQATYTLHHCLLTDLERRCYYSGDLFIYFPKAVSDYRSAIYYKCRYLNVGLLSQYL